jgi:hypothetical protein
MGVFADIRLAKFVEEIGVVGAKGGACESHSAFDFSK